MIKLPHIIPYAMNFMYCMVVFIGEKKTIRIVPSLRVMFVNICCTVILRLSCIDISFMSFLVAVLAYDDPLTLEIAIVYLSACYEPRKGNDNALVYS